MSKKQITNDQDEGSNDNKLQCDCAQNYRKWLGKLKKYMQPGWIGGGGGVGVGRGKGSEEPG